jgi:hypothetical protein
MDLRIDVESKLSQELSKLSDIERKQIAAVIQRDTDLRNNYLKQDRIKKLRQEIDLIEAESVDIPLEHIKTANFCSRCKKSFMHGFGFIYYSWLGQADSCPKCNLKICFQCRVNQNQSDGSEHKWVCKLCDKYMYAF